MDAKTINEIKARCEAATPGPWSYFYKRKYGEHHVSVPAYEDSSLGMSLFPDGCPSGEADAKLIANAWQDITALLADNAAKDVEIARLMARVDELKKQIKDDSILLFVQDMKFIRNDRDYWKARAESFERAIQDRQPCWACKREDECEFSNSNGCSTCEFEFDTEQFAAGEEGVNQ